MQYNNSRDTRAWWREPVLWIFILLAVAGAVISSVQSERWLATALLFIAVLLGLALIHFLTRKTSPEPVTVPRPFPEFGILLGWFCIYMLLSTLTKGTGLFSNEFAKWLWFVILPIALIVMVRIPGRDLKAVLRSIGLRRRKLGKSILLGLAAYAVFLPVLFFMIPAAQLEKLQELVQEPLRLLIIFPASLILSFVTAGITEEIFFRGILQSRLAVWIGSEIRSCLIMAFLFGIYHLPYAYYVTQWPTHGNLLWAVSGVLSEQMVMGVLLGFLWLRTHNIAASVTLHTLVNVIAIMTMFNINIG